MNAAKKFQVDLNKPFLDLDEKTPLTVDGNPEGQRLEPMNKMLAQLLKMSPTGDALKYLMWAIELFGKGVLILSREEYDELLKFVKGASSAAIVKGQLIQVFLDAVPPSGTVETAPAVEATATN